VVERPKNPEDVARLAANAAYAAVGFGVMGVQKLMATKDTVKTRLGPSGEVIDKRMGDLMTQLSTLRTQVGAQLTPVARDLVDRAQTGAKAVQDQVRGRSGTAGADESTEDQ
jgi:hypothetical protein